MVSLKKIRPKRGMTLVEVMFSLSIFILLGAMICSLMYSVNWSLFASRQKADIDRSFRTTTSELTRTVVGSDFIYVFDKMESYGKDGTKLAASKLAGESGELFVAVYYKNPGKVDPFTGKLDTTISRIVGVFRDVDRPADPASLADNEAPIYMFDSDVNTWNKELPFKKEGVESTDQVDSVVKLLPTLAQARGYKKLTDRAFATSTALNPLTGKPALFIVNGNATGALMLARIRAGMDGRYVSNAYAYPLITRNL